MRGKKIKKLKHPPYLKLKAALVEENIRQKALAELLGIAAVTVNQKINGTLEFTYTEAEKTADFLDRPVQVIFSTK